MATPKQVRAWLEQAEADLRASRVTAGTLGECHRRYWLQQSYEKGIKAYAIMRWTGPATDEAQFAKLFLLQHSPLKSVSDAATPLSKALHLLRREMVAFVRALDHADYRYPCVVEGDYVAPMAFGGWDAYQGNMAGAQAAIARLLVAVKDELRVFARTPK